LTEIDKFNLRIIWIALNKLHCSHLRKELKKDSHRFGKFGSRIWWEFWFIDKIMRDVDVVIIKSKNWISICEKIPINEIIVWIEW
jgi:hypothetical protein